SSSADRGESWRQMVGDPITNPNDVVYCEHTRRYIFSTGSGPRFYSMDGVSAASIPGVPSATSYLGAVLGNVVIFGSSVSEFFISFNGGLSFSREPMPSFTLQSSNYPVASAHGFTITTGNGLIWRWGGGLEWVQSSHPAITGNFCGRAYDKSTDTIAYITDGGQFLYSKNGGTSFTEGPAPPARSPVEIGRAS